MIGSAPSGSQNWACLQTSMPKAFLTAAKRNFADAAVGSDRSDITTCAPMMTDEMPRGKSAASCPSAREPALPVNPTTPTLMIEANCWASKIWAMAITSVEFSGMIREEASAGPSPFREVWNMTKPKSGTSRPAGGRRAGAAISAAGRDCSHGPCQAPSRLRVRGRPAAMGCRPPWEGAKRHRGINFLE